MHAKAQPPLSDGVNPTEDAIDDAIASAAAEEAAADPNQMVPVSISTSRRGFLRGALAVAGGTAAAAALAACAPASGSAWSYAPLRTLTAAAEGAEGLGGGDAAALIIGGAKLRGTNKEIFGGIGAAVAELHLGEGFESRCSFDFSGTVCG